MRVVGGEHQRLVSQEVPHRHGRAVMRERRADLLADDLAGLAGKLRAHVMQMRRIDFIQNLGQLIKEAGAGFHGGDAQFGKPVQPPPATR